MYNFAYDGNQGNTFREGDACKKIYVNKMSFNIPEGALGVSMCAQFRRVFLKMPLSTGIGK